MGKRLLAPRGIPIIPLDGSQILHQLDDLSPYNPMKFTVFHSYL